MWPYTNCPRKNSFYFVWLVIWWGVILLPLWKNYIIFGFKYRKSSICKTFTTPKLWDGKIAIHGLDLPWCASCTPLRRFGVVNVNKYTITLTQTKYHIVFSKGIVISLGKIAPSNISRRRIFLWLQFVVWVQLFEKPMHMNEDLLKIIFKKELHLNCRKRHSNIPWKNCAVKH